MTVFTVADFITHINDVLARAWDAEALCVEGEVSGFRISQGQWVNFDLKDDQGLVSVFMTVWQLRVPLEDGMKVRVFGTPRIYPKFGKFSISATHVDLVGEGALKKALAALKARLEAEGLFDETRKRALPVFPNRIALIASRESAAYGDFVRIVGERWRGLEIDSYHVKVQGMGAADEIVQAIRQANAYQQDYDVLVLTRGGGSLEELMAFNDEQVVRAIHASRIPTLVGIGHERDLSLAELAADVRGSTPTDCARRLVPDRKDVLRDLAFHTDRIEGRLRIALQVKHDLLERAMRLPLLWINERQMQLKQSTSLCHSNVQQWIKALRDRLRNDTRLLASLDPKGVLMRGYTILRDHQGKALVSIKSLTVGQSVTVVLRDGEGEMSVKAIRGRQPSKQQKLL